jgi:hypothetical protein
MHLTLSGKRNVVTNFTKVSIDGKDSIGGYPWLGGAVQALDPFNNEGRFNVPLTRVARYLPLLSNKYFVEAY